MYADIVAALTGADFYPVDYEDCRDTLKLLHAFYRSDEAGDWVVLMTTLNPSPRPTG